MRAAVLAALFACGGAAKPAAPVQRPAAVAVPVQPRPVERRESTAPPPPFDLAAVLPPHDPPWPLTELPSVQPHLDAAMAHDACSEEFAKRHSTDADLRAYVAAWCRIREDRSAVDELGRLARAARDDIARAARLDVVNLLADEVVAQDALNRLESMKLAQSDTLDLLAATYVALGARADGRVVAQYVERANPNPSPIVRCERLLAWSRLDDAYLLEHVKAAGDSAGTCSQRAREVRCMLEGMAHASENELRKCFALDVRDPDRGDKMTVVHLYASWYHDWVSLLAIGRRLAGKLRVEGAEELAVRSLEAALLDAHCDEVTVAGVRDAATTLLRDDHHSSVYDARLQALAKAASCKVQP